MPGEQARDEALFATTWVHVFEEDSAAGQVYRPEDSDIPLSRRPRERLQLARDGSARVLRAGPDDRYVARSATWQEEHGALVVRAAEMNSELRIVEHSPSRLVVKRLEQGSS